MAKPSHREKILTEGLRVVHQHGFGGASVRDIVQAAGVPQGSFTNHFGSKESFGLEIIELYFSNSREVMAATLLNDELPPLKRLSDYMDKNREHLQQDEMRNGCLYGNFTAEASDHSEPIRTRLVEIFTEVQRSLAYCLTAAVKAGELPADFDCNEIAGFIVSSLQGANLIAKGYRDVEPLNRFKHVLFSTILKHPF